MSTVPKRERALLVVANLSHGGDPRFQWLYQWLDENSLQVVNILMEPHYQHIDSLTGSDVTIPNFVSRIIQIATDPQFRVLDVFLSLHGSINTLYFEDGSITSSDLKRQLQGANLKHRLRLLYSTACYGATHARDFLNAGFRVTSGALGVNANGPYDYPTQLYNWGKENTYKSTVKAGNHPIGILTHDTIAKAFGFDDVNSEKIIEGKKYTRITSSAI